MWYIQFFSNRRFLQLILLLDEIIRTISPTRLTKIRRVRVRASEVRGPLFVESTIIAFGSICNLSRITRASTTCRDYVRTSDERPGHIGTTSDRYVRPFETAVAAAIVPSDPITNYQEHGVRTMSAYLPVSSRQNPAHRHVLETRHRPSRALFAPRQWLSYFPDDARQTNL